MFGKKNKLIAELELKLEEERACKNSAEFSLARARIGLDEETNAFFRDHPVYVAAEQVADTGAGADVAKKSRAKKDK